MNILDVGCGNGKWLRTLMEWGATANNLHGIDLLPDRVEKALQVSPNIDFIKDSEISVLYTGIFLILGFVVICVR